jgi:hypothetical protein
VRERLDDKPISEALRGAFANASAQRVGARSVLQGILSSERSALSLNDLLARRRKRKPAATSNQPQQPT